MLPAYTISCNQSNDQCTMIGLIDQCFGFIHEAVTSTMKICSTVPYHGSKFGNCVTLGLTSSDADDINLVNIQPSSKVNLYGVRQVKLSRSMM